MREYAARPTGSLPLQVPPALQDYIERVARHAHTVSDADVAALRQAGVSKDTLFQLTVSAAFGAGLGRFDPGLAALRGEI